MSAGRTDRELADLRYKAGLAYGLGRISVWWVIWYAILASLMRGATRALSWVDRNHLLLGWVIVLACVLGASVVGAYLVRLVLR